MAAAADRGLDEDAVDDLVAVDGVEHAVALADAVGHGVRVDRGQLRPRGVRGDERGLAVLQLGGELEDRLGDELAARARVHRLLERIGDGELPIGADRALHAVDLGVEPPGVLQVLREGCAEVEPRILAQPNGLHAEHLERDLERLLRTVEAAVDEQHEDVAQLLELAGHRLHLLDPQRGEGVFSALAADAALAVGVADDEDLLHLISPWSRVRASSRDWLPLLPGSRGLEGALNIVTVFKAPSRFFAFPFFKVLSQSVS